MRSHRLLFAPFALIGVVALAGCPGPDPTSPVVTFPPPPPAGAPAAPVNLVAEYVTSSRVDLRWVDNATNEDGYRVERCLGSSCTDFSVISTLPGNSTAIGESGLHESTTYRYRVQAFNAVGGSSYTGPISTTTLAAASVPLAPTNFTATFVSLNRVDLAWTDNATNEDEYDLEVCKDVGCKDFILVQITSPNATASSIAMPLTPASAYGYRLSALNGAGRSGAVTASITTPNILPLPAAPGAFTATATSPTEIRLTWTDQATNEAGFRIERCAGADCATYANYVFLANAGANTTTFVDGLLTPNTPYRYRIQAFNSSGVSLLVGPAIATTPDLPPSIILTPSTSRNYTLLAAESAKTDSVAVTNGGGGTLTGLATAVTYGSGGSGWLQAALGGTTAPTTLTLTVSRGSLAAGIYQAVVTISATGAANSPKQLLVQLTVQAPTASPAISLSVTSRSFTATAGGASPPSQEAQIGNSGGGTLSGLTVTENPAASWLAVTLSSTTAPASMTFQVTTGTLAAGTYTTTVNVTSPVASNSPQPVAVTFTVAPQQTAASTVLIINDLTGTVAGTNDWSKLNTVVRVRVGATEANVLSFSGDARELLNPADYTSDWEQTLAIPTGGQATLTVPAYTNDYWLFIQTGWWEYFADAGEWEKHMALVVGCNQQTTYKWTTIHVTQPFGHPEVIRLSDFLPQGNWYGSSYCP